MVIAPSLYTYWPLEGFIGMLYFRVVVETCIYYERVHVYIYTQEKSTYFTQKHVLKILEWLSKG